MEVSRVPSMKAESRYVRWLPVVLWLPLVLAVIPVREVMPPDESRFAHQAQVMKETGDWIVPKIGDVPIADKPPLLFWAIDVVSLPAAHVKEWTARVPSALASLVVLLLVVRMGRRLWGSTATGVGGAAILLTGIEFFQKSQWVSCDMLMTSLAWIATTCWREALFEDGPAPASRSEESGGDRLPRSRRRLMIALGWAAAGAGILTKGPVGLLWPAFWVVAEAGARRRWRPLIGLLRPEGPTLLLAIVGSWLAAVGARAGAAFVENAVFAQTVTRYLSAPNSIEPWHFYFRQLPADLLPWSFLIPAVLALIAVRSRGPSQAPETSATRASALFLLIGFLFFSFSTGKRGVYLLPAFPVFSLLAADAFLRAGGSRAPGRWWRDGPLLGMAALGLGLALAPFLILSGSLPGSQRVTAFAGATDLVAFAIGGLSLAVGAMAALRLARGGRPERSLAAVVAGLAALLLALGTFGGATWTRYQGGRDYGSRVEALVPPEGRIAIERGKFELILFYSRRKGTEIETYPQLLDEMSSGRCSFAILAEKRYEALRDLAPLRSMRLILEARVGGATYDLLGPPG
jgi:4-amino-4-deoxy-L-arabinose transferase-like glycosyltransferase